MRVCEKRVTIGLAGTELSGRELPCVDLSFRFFSHLGYTSPFISQERYERFLSRI